MSQQALIERFFETLIVGDREAARGVIDECLESEAPAEMIVEELMFPTLGMVQRLYRQDQLSTIAHHYATRLLRTLVDQMQMRLERGEAKGKTALVLCGPTEHDELAGQMAADRLEAAGYEVLFPGGGVANDEIVSEINQRGPSALVLFGTNPHDLPHLRSLIDYLHDIGACPNTQVAVGGGVFNRADGLAEEIGADLWAKTPGELVRLMEEQPDRRMGEDQRTVGRRRQQGQGKKKSGAAA